MITTDPLHETGRVVPGDPWRFVVTLPSALPEGDAPVLTVDTLPVTMTVDDTRLILSATLTVAQGQSVMPTGSVRIPFRVTVGTGEALVPLVAGWLDRRSKWDGSRPAGLAVSVGASEAAVARVAAAAAQVAQTAAEAAAATAAGASDAGVGALVSNPASATRAALSSTYATVAQGAKADSAVQPAALTSAVAASATTLKAQGASRNTIALIGDSITVANRGTAGILTTNGPRGFWTHAAQRLGQRFDVLSFAGVGGQTTTQIAARFAADVVAYSPGWVHILAGTNDIVGSATFATITGNLTTMLNQAEAAGIRAIVGTIPPNDNYANNGAQFKTLMKVNEWIRSLPLSRNGVIIVDYYTLLADPATGQYITGMSPTADGTHPSTRGAVRMGRALAAALDAITPKRNALPTSNRDLPDYLTVDNIATGTPMFAAGGGSLVNSASGTVPAGWTMGNAAGVVGSLVARTDGVGGNWSRLTISSGAGRLYCENPYGAGVHWAVGDSIYGIGEFKADAAWTSLTTLRFRIMAYNGGAELMAMDDFAWDNITGETWDAENQPTAGVIHTFRTPTMVIPATTTKIMIEAYATLVGAIDFGRMAIRHSQP